MSGGQTYYTSGGSGGKSHGPVRIPHPARTDNPHDPSHYYLGEDEKYYYTPDGNPVAGHPAKQTEPPSQYQLKPLGTPTTWKHEADTGYKMHPEGLRNLAKKLDQDLADLKYVIQQNAQPDISGAAGAMGNGYDAAEDYDKLARSSSTAFLQQYGALIATYETVINLLKATADNGQDGEDKTHGNVTQTAAQVGGYTGGPNMAM